MQGLPKLQNALLSEVKLGLGYNSMVEGLLQPQAEGEIPGFNPQYHKKFKKKK